MYVCTVYQFMSEFRDWSFEKNELFWEFYGSGQKARHCNYRN